MHRAEKDIMEGEIYWSQIQRKQKFISSFFLLYTLVVMTRKKQCQRSDTWERIITDWENYTCCIAEAHHIHVYATVEVEQFLGSKLN